MKCGECNCDNAPERIVCAQCGAWLFEKPETVKIKNEVVASTIDSVLARRNQRQQRQLKIALVVLLLSCVPLFMISAQLLFVPALAAVFLFIKLSPTLYYKKEEYEAVQPQSGCVYCGCPQIKKVNMDPINDWRGCCASCNKVLYHVEVK